jgi:hypothetical protein
MEFAFEMKRDESAQPFFSLVIEQFTRAEKCGALIGCMET